MRIQFLFAYYFRGKNRETDKVNIDQYAHWESPPMEHMEKIREPWQALISMDLLTVQAFVDSSATSLAIFFTMNPKALLELDRVDPVCANALINRIIANKVIHSMPNVMANFMIPDNTTRDLIHDALLAPIIYDPTLPIKYPYHRATALSPHVYQDLNIQWMIERDKTPLKLQYRPVQYHRLIMPDTQKQLLCNPEAAYHTLPSFSDEKSIEIRGGVLADEMGLGKTLCFLMLCIGTQPDEWKVEGKEFHSRATLIVLPSHLCGQWETEIQLIIKPNANTKIVRMFTKTHFKCTTLRDLLEADFVITSFAYLIRDDVGDPFEKKGVSAAALKVQLDAHRAEKYRKVRKHPKLLDQKGFMTLFAIKWHRLAIDEIQEAIKHKYSPIAELHKGAMIRKPNLSELLLLFESPRRWILSGTPFGKDDGWFENLSYVLAFITGEADAIGASLSMSTLMILAKLFHKNTKENTKVEVKLPPIEERIIRIPFSMQERILYTAYVADGSHGGDDEGLRMICCHPDLASEAATISTNSSSKVRKQLTRKYQGELRELKVKVIRYKRMQTNLCDRLERLGVMVERIPDSDVEEEEKNSEGSDDDSDNKSSSNEDEESSNEESGSDSDSGSEDSDSSSESGDSSDSDIVVAGKGSSINKPGSDDEERKGGEEGKDPEAEEEARLRAEMSAEQLQQNLRSVQENLRTSRSQADGKARSFNFMRNVTKHLGKKRPECIICLEKVKRDDTGLTTCGHIFCYGCIMTAYKSNPKCPTCRSDLKPADIHHVVDSKKGKRKIQQWGSKLNYLIKLMKASSKKVIIFSQWTSLLKKVGTVLKKNGVGNVFCTGNVHQKNKSLIRFRTDKKIQALMMSTTTSAAGANLTEAEYVIFLDPIAGPHRKATEAQAVSRLVRIGQKAKRVKVWRLVIKNTIEDAIVSAPDDPAAGAIANPDSDAEEENERNV